jgi:hypothetical protein
MVITASRILTYLAGRGFGTGALSPLTILDLRVDNAVRGFFEMHSLGCTGAPGIGDDMYLSGEFT